MNNEQTKTLGNESPKTVKINKDRYESWKGNVTTRSTDEETETTPRTTHAPRKESGKGKESDGYYNVRKLTFDLLKREYRTPQSNLDLIVETFNTERLAKGKEIVRSVYYAKGFQIKFFIADDASGYIAFDVSKRLDAIKFTERLIRFANQ
jgi:hypothetical protein